jgi:hypothetical protein
MRRCELIALALAAATLAGCNTVDPPLVFAKANTYGVSIAATVPDQGGNLTLGYRAAHLAVVPVTAHDTSGQVVPVLANQVSNTQKSQEAFSTFAHFEANNSVPIKACLGDTFATGYAAQRIAQNLANVCP